MATIFDMIISFVGSTTALFFCMLILLVIVIYVALEQSDQRKGLEVLVAKNNAVYNTLYGEEGMAKIREANKMLQDLQGELTKIAQMREKAQEIVAKGGKP